MKTLPLDFRPQKVYFPELKPDDNLLPNGTDYILKSDYSFIVEGRKGAFRVIAKKDYIYNGFSVPSLVRFIQGKHDGAIGVSLFHDLDFDCHWSNTQSNGNWILLLGLINREYSWFRRNMIYSGVQLAGWISYSKDLEYIKKLSQFVEIVEV